MNLGWIFIPYISTIQGMEFICVTLQNFHNLMRWNFIWQGDEIQGVILIQNESMSSNHLTYEISPSISMVFSATKMWITGCVFQPDKMEISYHYEVGKCLSLKVELTVYVSCPKEGFWQGISQILFHTSTTAGWTSSCCHLCIVGRQLNIIWSIK